MNRRDAKREAYWAAYELLSSGPMPISRLSLEGVAESESSSANFRRFKQAWEDLLAELFKKGRLE